MSDGKLKLARMLDNGANNLNGAGLPQPTMTTGVNAEMTPLSGNFNVTVRKYYFTLTGGTYTAIAGASLNATLQTGLPVYLFGSADFQVAYKKMNDLFPVSNTNWTFSEAGIFGARTFENFDYTDTAITALLQKGDVIQLFTSALPGSGTTTLCIIVQRSQEIPFGSLVQNVEGGDKIGIVKIRETMSNDNAVYSAQNQNTMYFFTESILGKTTFDGLPVQSEISGFQYNQNIVDINVNRLIDKYNGFNFNLEYTTPQMTLTFMCGMLQKA